MHLFSSVIWTFQLHVSIVLKRWIIMWKWHSIDELLIFSLYDIFSQSSWIPTAQYVGSPIITQFCLECARRLLLPVLHHLPVITSSSGELLWWSYLWIQHWSCFRSDPSFNWMHPVWPISARSCLSVPGRMFGGDCNVVGTVHLHYSGVCHDWISYRCLDF